MQRKWSVHSRPNSIHPVTEKHDGTQWEKKRTQAMHLPGQKQCRTTGAATVQEKETLVVQAKKNIPTPTTR